MTYSVVARDPETGAFGVAVQSHYFSVGAVVPWVEAGVGAVATQAFSDITYGPLGVERMRAGERAGDALGVFAQFAEPDFAAVEHQRSLGAELFGRFIEGLRH